MFKCSIILFCLLSSAAQAGYYQERCFDDNESDAEKIVESFLGSFTEILSDELTDVDSINNKVDDPAPTFLGFDICHSSTKVYGVRAVLKTDGSEVKLKLHGKMTGGSTCTEESYRVSGNAYIEKIQIYLAQKSLINIRVHDSDGTVDSFGAPFNSAWKTSTSADTIKKSYSFDVFDPLIGFRSSFVENSKSSWWNFTPISLDVNCNYINEDEGMDKGILLWILIGVGIVCICIILCVVVKVHDKYMKKERDAEKKARKEKKERKKAKKNRQSSSDDSSDSDNEKKLQVATGVPVNQQMANSMYAQQQQQQMQYAQSMQMSMHQQQQQMQFAQSQVPYPPQQQMNMMNISNQGMINGQNQPFNASANPDGTMPTTEYKQ